MSIQTNARDTCKKRGRSVHVKDTAEMNGEARDTGRQTDRQMDLPEVSRRVLRYPVREAFHYTSAGSL